MDVNGARTLIYHRTTEYFFEYRCYPKFGGKADISQRLPNNRD
jgi:hypothetical protein